MSEDEVAKRGMVSGVVVMPLPLHGADPAPRIAIAGTSLTPVRSHGGSITPRSLTLADPDIKAAAYTELGISVTHHADGRALLESRPRIDRVAGAVGGTRGPDSRRVALSAELALMTARIQAVASAQSEKTSDSRP